MKKNYSEFNELPSYLVITWCIVCWKKSHRKKGAACKNIATYWNHHSYGMSSIKHKLSINTWNVCKWTLGNVKVSEKYIIVIKSSIKIWIFQCPRDSRIYRHELKRYKDLEYKKHSRSILFFELLMIVSLLKTTT